MVSKVNVESQYVTLDKETKKTIQASIFKADRNTSKILQIHKI